MPVEPGRPSFRKPTAPPPVPRRDPGPASAAQTSPDEAPPGRAASEEAPGPERPGPAAQD